MALPKTTLDRILADADKFAFVVPYDGSNKFYNDDLLKGYIAGATAENERAQAKIIEMEAGYLKQMQKLVEALEFVKANGLCSEATALINESLQQYNATPDRPCPHCGKELNRDRNLCCRECGEEVIVQPKVDLGKCRQCNKPATKDYNNHEYNVCDACYDRLNSEFDREYN